MIEKMSPVHVRFYQKYLFRSKFKNSWEFCEFGNSKNPRIVKYEQIKSVKIERTISYWSKIIQFMMLLSIPSFAVSFDWCNEKIVPYGVIFVANILLWSKLKKIEKYVCRLHLRIVLILLILFITHITSIPAIKPKNLVIK